MSSQPDSSAGPRGVWFMGGGLFRPPPEGVPKACPQLRLEEVSSIVEDTGAPSSSKAASGKAAFEDLIIYNQLSTGSSRIVETNCGERAVGTSTALRASEYRRRTLLT